jgi:hypothetical protein
LCTLTAILQEATLATGAAPTSAQLSAIYAGKGLRQSESNLRKYLQILEIAPAALKELLAHAVTEQQEELFTLTNLFGTITAITEPDKASKQLEVVKRMEEAYKRSKGRAVGGAEAVQKICDTVTAAFKQAAMLATVISVERLEPWIPAETVAKWQAELRAGDYDGLINNNLTETGFITRIDKLLTHARNQKKGQDMAEAKERVAEAARAASAASSATQTNSQSSETAEPVALASTTAATRGDGVSSAPSPGESSFMSNSGSGSGSNSGSPGLGSVDSSGSTSVSEELKSVDVSRPVAVDRFLARVSFLSTEWVKFPEHPAADWASFKHKAKLIFYHTTDDHDPKIVIDILSHLLHREGTAFLLSCSVHDLMKLEKAAKHFLISEPQLLVLVYKNQAVCRTRLVWNRIGHNAVPFFFSLLCCYCLFGGHADMKECSAKLYLRCCYTRVIISTGMCRSVLYRFFFLCMMMILFRLFLLSGFSLFFLLFSSFFSSTNQNGLPRLHTVTALKRLSQSLTISAQLMPRAASWSDMNCMPLQSNF